MLSGDEAILRANLRATDHTLEVMARKGEAYFAPFQRLHNHVRKQLAALEATHEASRTRHKS